MTIETLAPCRHWWIIAEHRSRYSQGRCKLCGEERMFDNSWAYGIIPPRPSGVRRRLVADTMGFHSTLGGLLCRKDFAKMSGEIERQQLRNVSGRRFTKPLAAGFGRHHESGGMGSSNLVDIL